MKKLFLPLILMLIFLIPGMQVDADECENLYPDPPGTLFQTGSGSWIYYNSATVELDSSKGYVFYATLDGKLVDRLLLTSTGSMSLGDSTFIPDGFSGNTRTIKNKTSFNFWYVNPSAENLAEYQSWQYWIVEGTEVCIPTPEPEEPDPGTGKEEVIPDTTLDNFFSIYVTKLSDLSKYALENKFFLGFIAIILAFIVLELFLRLFNINKGGYKR